MNYKDKKWLALKSFHINTFKQFQTKRNLKSRNMINCCEISHILSSNTATSFGYDNSRIIFERMEKRKKAWPAELVIYVYLKCSPL